MDSQHDSKNNKKTRNKVVNQNQQNPPEKQQINTQKKLGKSKKGETILEQKLVQVETTINTVNSRGTLYKLQKLKHLEMKKQEN